MHSSSKLIELIEIYLDTEKDNNISVVEKELNLFIEDSNQSIIHPEKINDLLFLIRNNNESSNNTEIKEGLTEIRSMIINQEKRSILDGHLSKELSYTETNFNIDYLITEFSKQRMQMPKYQRSFVWDIEQVGEFVFSLLRGIPIPKLYGYSLYDEDIKRNIKLIVDGQQRLTSILMYYYGIFPKYKVRTINYSEHMTEIVKLCNYYYESEIYETEARRLVCVNEKKIMEDEISNAKDLLEKKYNLNLDVEFEINIVDKTNATKKINISYRHPDSILSEKEKHDLLDKELGFVLIKGDPSSSIDIFRLYNSAGSPLSDQEIRNGVYYRNPLYELINTFNEETGRIAGTLDVKNRTWNNIRTRGTEKGDVQQLFSMLAFHFDLTHKKDSEDKFLPNDTINDIINDEDVEYSILKDKKASIINNYSLYISQKGNNKVLIEGEFNTLKNFFSMKFENQRDSGKRFKNYVAIFIILKYFNLLNKDIAYEDITIPEELLIYSEDSNDKPKGYLTVSQLQYVYKRLKQEPIFNEHKD